MCHARRDYSDDESSFHGCAKRAAVNVPEIISNWSGASFSLLYPTHTRGSPQVLCTVDHGTVVGARQVVVGDGLKIDPVVSTVRVAHPLGCLIERICNCKVRARHHPVARISDKAVVASGAAMNNAVSLCTRFIKHNCGEVVLTQIGQAKRVG